MYSELNLSHILGPNAVESVDATMHGDLNKKVQLVVESKKEGNAALAQRIEILDWHHANGKNQSKTAKHFSAVYPGLSLKQPRVSAWLRDESKS